MALTIQLISGLIRDLDPPHPSKFKGCLLQEVSKTAPNTATVRTTPTAPHPPTPRPQPFSFHQEAFIEHLLKTTWAQERKRGLSLGSYLPGVYNYVGKDV